jgi:pimeloyl-ACP methyl ester carboxylesterase
LNWYRSRTGSRNNDDLLMFSGSTIDVPSCFIAGTSDWGSYQRPGALEKMLATVCTQMKGVHMLPGAGHWVQQEQPEQVTNLLLGMLK